MANIANKDAAMDCFAKARTYAQAGDYSNAEKFAQKALRLYDSDEIKSFIASIQRKQENGTASGENETATPSAHTAETQSAGPKLPKKNVTDGLKHRAGTASSVAENLSTPEQRQLVSQILAAKDFYEVLQLTKEATDDDVKKAYRKLALKLHPDKNKAPRAEDAFKIVSKAFSCLSDTEKRAYYDRTGYESPSVAQAARSSSTPSRGGMRTHFTADDIDPEEIFNMFFGGPGVRVYRTNFGAVPRRQQAQNTPQEQQQRSMMLGLVQFLPILLIIAVSLFQSNTSTPIFSLSPDKQYTVKMTTQRLSVPFYVRSEQELAQSYPKGSSSRYRLERQVEEHYIERLQQRCQQEKTNQHRLWTWGRRDEANNMQLPACDEITELHNRFGSRGYIL